MSRLDPILTTIAAHRAAYDAFQVAPDGEPSIDANCAMSDALDALVLAACAFPVLARPLPDESAALLAHLRWWLAEEAVHAGDYQPEYGILEARAADLAVVSEQVASIKKTISGEQRFRNIRTRMRLVADREMRAFDRGEIATCGDSDARERALIAREFDRVFCLGATAGSRFYAAAAPAAERAP